MLSTLQVGTKTKKIKKQYRGVTRATRVMRGFALWVPAIIMAVMIIFAIFSPWIAPHDPTVGDIKIRYLTPGFSSERLNSAGKIVTVPSNDYVLGTDQLGRDILSRLIYGARISLSVSLIAILITAGIGTILGIAAGYGGGRTDAIIMRIVDVALSFPGLLLAMLLAVAIGPGFWTVVFALSLLGWAGYARMIRGEALRISQSDFVAQARVVGASPWRIMTRHIFPNIINSLIVLMTLQVGMMILAEAALSYLGIGISVPTPSWGAMVSDGRANLDNAWWISAFPGACIGLVVLAGNFLGDWIRDKLDPRLRTL
jgi:peptide/nickel transport system permease protein